MKNVDYIVVGGGSTGCVVASRLSEDAACTVTLLEEGPHDLNPYIHIPGAYYKTAQGPLLKRFPWEPTAAQGRNEQPTMVQASVAPVAPAAAHTRCISWKRLSNRPCHEAACSALRRLSTPADKPASSCSTPAMRSDAR